MGQGDSFIGTASSVQQQNEFLGWKDTKTAMRDEMFKEVFKYKWAAAIVLKNCIPEYKDMHPLEICRLIVNTKDRGPQSDEDLVQDEVDLVSDVEGTGVQKKTVKDLVFRAYTDESRRIMNLITVNFEMQNKFQKEKPNTISRAVYYAAGMLQSTVPAGDTAYAGMHKVYSIWLCAESVTLEVDLSSELKEKGYDDRYFYKTRFRMCRIYDEALEYSYSYDKEADLMEVVMFDLRVLQSKVEAGAANKDEVSLFKSLYDVPSAVDFMEKVYEVDLTSYKKGVSETMSLVELVEEVKKESREKDAKIEEQGIALKEKDEEIEELRRLVEKLQKNA